MPSCVAFAVNVGELVRSGPDACVESSALARPKSRILTTPSSRTLMLAGFRSRWTMPCSCAASSASAIWREIERTSASGIGPAAMRSASVGPLTSSMTSARVAPASSTPYRCAMFGWLSEASTALRGRTAPAVGSLAAVGQDLQRDLAVQFRVVGAQDLAHAAFAQLVEDPIRAERASDHALRRIIPARADQSRRSVAIGSIRPARNAGISAAPAHARAAVNQAAGRASVLPHREPLRPQPGGEFRFHAGRKPVRQARESFHQIEPQPAAMSADEAS